MFLLFKYISTKNQEKILERESRRFYGKYAIPVRLFFIKYLSYLNINNSGKESKGSKYLSSKYSKK